MAYTDKEVADLTTEVRRLFNEPVPMSITDTDINKWLDFAVNKMSDAGLLGEVTEELQFDGSTPEQKLAYTIFHPVAVIYEGASTSTPGATSSPVQAPFALTKTNYRQMAHNQTDPGASSTYPTEWWAEGGYIHFWPPPGTDLANHYIRVFGYTRYDTYDKTKVPSWLQEYTIWYALSMAFEKIGNYAAAQQYMSVFDNFISFHRQEMISDIIDAKDDMRQKDRTQVIGG